ncbi:MAG: class I SAM-dependent methyltransferase [Anaerolineae bacterium]|nr:class I SAM-dependent methyltransferase [Anaerolineae bacterium]
MSDSSFVSANIERFTGFADYYARYRPTPPPVIPDILTQLARVARPHLVVDLGSGTGLSTRIWAERADSVIGIEPSDDMCQQAVKQSSHFSNVRYQHGLSTATGLPDNCADIVTASQALHWMEPTGTFAEVMRILRPGGVFAALDNDWPPTMDWEAMQAYETYIDNAEKLAREKGMVKDVRKWDKAGHLARMQASGRFRYITEFAVHHTEPGSAERLVGMALSQGVSQTLLKNGLPEEQFGVTALREIAQRTLGDTEQAWHFTYRVRVGVK